jgi:N6-adenosine-specific RNA methylase IME4
MKNKPTFQAEPQARTMETVNLQPTFELTGTPPVGSGALLGVTVKFKTIVADPPWDVKAGPRSLHDPNEKSRLLEYPTMSVEEISAIQVPADDDAHLYIWTINAYIEETYAIARAWGFEPSTLLTWLKQPKGRGLGGTFSTCTEFVLFARRGTLTAKKRCDRNWWGWGRGEHSAKPEEFQTVVESVSPGPYLEMFARRKRHGWHSWGNEVPNDVNLVTPNHRRT